jgi:hypothetical protein
MSVWGTQGRSNPPAARFNELLDQLKMEFTSQHDRAEGNDQQCKNIFAQLLEPRSRKFCLLL